MKGGKWSRLFAVFVLTLGLTVGVVVVQEEVRIKSKASGTTANLVVDISSSFTDAKNSWKNLAQGGEERGRSILPVIAEVSELDPNYIRIDHVYDFFDVVSRSPSGELQFNWTNLDKYISDIRATGATPFLSLSYMPQVISTGTETDAPRNFNDWSFVVQKTIEHVSGRSGLAIPNVYYEIWNEPDLFGGFKVYPPKNYSDLYSYASIGAQNAANALSFRLGGPATTALYKNWFDSLVDLKSKKRIRLDFFSWHRYSADINVFERDFSELTDWIRKAGEMGIETIISEYGINSANDSDYDGIKSAIHTLAASGVLADKVDKVFSFEIKDGPGSSKFWGRWGILTHEKWGQPVKKPRYEALKFLNNMSSQERLNVAGEGTFVKALGRKENNTYKLLVVNYDDSAAHVEAVPIKFVGIPFSKFKVVRKDFRGRTSEFQITEFSGSWSTVAYFQANSAAIFELTQVQ